MAVDYFMLKQASNLHLQTPPLDSMVSMRPLALCHKSFFCRELVFANLFRKWLRLCVSCASYAGWSTSIKDITIDFNEKDKSGFSVGISAIVRVTLRDGCFHEDIGYGEAKLPSRAAALEKSRKQAVTDATKRALKMFGNCLGQVLCLTFGHFSLFQKLLSLLEFSQDCLTFLVFANQKQNLGDRNYLTAVSVIL